MNSNGLSLSLFVLGTCTGLALAQPPATAPTTTTTSLNQSRTPHHKPVPGVIEEMAPQELGNFDYDAEKGGTIPPDVMALDGTTVRLRGYMIPMDQSEKIAVFALVGDLWAVPQKPPVVQQTIVVKMPQGKPTSYTAEMITVEGKLHVRVEKDDGFIVSIFDLDATSVQTSAPPSTQRG